MEQEVWSKVKTIIMTIKPCHLGNIRRGKKVWELRKTAPKPGEAYRVLLCESGSGGQIKAEFTCVAIFYNKPWEINKDVEKHVCLSRKEILEYLNGKDACIWDISQVIDYCSTKGYHVRNISEFGLKRPPQSWQYISEGACECAGLP